VFLAAGDVLIATGVAIAGGIGQFIYARIRRTKLDTMTWASLALVILLGSATLLTNDPRFVLMKPSIAHFAIGTIMLRRGWMLRYQPDIVKDNAADVAVIAGYAWSALMFVLGAGVIATALTGDVKLWAFYVTVIAVGAKIVAFAIQYFVTRVVITRRLSAAALQAR
jgi:intracellular septation protein A